MFKKIEVNILDSNKPSIVTIHETSFPTISIKLNSTNYCVWSQIMDMHFVGRRKKGSIIGRKAPPAKNNPSYDEWEAKDVLVKS